MSTTSGTVEFGRTKNMGDYSNKVSKITRHYALDPGEIAAAVEARILAEITELVGIAVGEIAPVSNVRDQPKPAKMPPKVAAEIQRRVDLMVAPEQPVEAPTSATPLPEQAGDIIITDDAMMKACQRTTARLHSPAQTKAVIAKYVEKVGMSVITIPQDKRAEFIAELDALKHEDAE